MAKRLDAYNIKPASEEGKKAFWNKIGSAFVNKDGSINVHLDSLPLDGKIHLREYVPKESKGESFGDE